MRIILNYVNYYARLTDRELCIQKFLLFGILLFFSRRYYSFHFVASVLYYTIIHRHHTIPNLHVHSDNNDHNDRQIIKKESVSDCFSSISIQRPLRTDSRVCKWLKLKISVFSARRTIFSKFSLISKFLRSSTFSTDRVSPTFLASCCSRE